MLNELVLFQELPTRSLVRAFLSDGATASGPLGAIIRDNQSSKETSGRARKGEREKERGSERVKDLKNDSGFKAKLERERERDSGNREGHQKCPGQAPAALRRRAEGRGREALEGGPGGKVHTA